MLAYQLEIAMSEENQATTEAEDLNESTEETSSDESQDSAEE